MDSELLEYTEKLQLIKLLNLTSFPRDTTSRMALCSKIGFNYDQFALDGSSAADIFSTNLIECLIKRDNKEELCRLCDLLKSAGLGSNHQKELQKIQDKLGCDKKTSENFFPPNPKPQPSPDPIPKPNFLKFLTIVGIVGVVLLGLGNMGKDTNTSPTPNPTNSTQSESNNGCNAQQDPNNPKRWYFGHTEGVYGNTPPEWCSAEYNVRCLNVAATELSALTFGVDLNKSQCYYEIK